MSVDADASNEDYGTLRVLTLPGNTQILGPGQIANQFGSNTTIQNELAKLTRNANVRVLNGNLLTLPVGVTDDNSDGGLLYVQPLYAVRSGTSTANYPVLQYVLVSLGSRSGIGESVAEAVADVLGTTLEETPPLRRTAGRRRTPVDSRTDSPRRWCSCSDVPTRSSRPPSRRWRPVTWPGTPSRPSGPRCSCSAPWPRPSCPRRTPTEATDRHRFGRTPRGR